MNICSVFLTSAREDFGLEVLAGISFGEAPETSCSPGVDDLKIT